MGNHVSDVPPPRTRGTQSETVRLAGLRPVYERPALGVYLSELWDRRHFIVADARGRVVSNARGLVLGTGWLIFRPVLDGLAYWAIFGLLLGLNRGIDNFLGYLIIGVFLFRFTSQSLNGGAHALIRGKNLLKAFTFPRASLPTASVMRETFSMMPVLAVMFVLILALPPAEVISWRWLLFPLVFALHTLFNFGLALWAARVVARLPDVGQLIRVFTRFWLYGSAVFFSIDRFVDHPGLQAIMRMNPMFVVLDMSRDLLLYGLTPTLTSWLTLVGWSIAVAVGGMVFFWRGEERYGAL